jgi:hypothetical protein
MRIISDRKMRSTTIPPKTQPVILSNFFNILVANWVFNMNRGGDNSLKLNPHHE